MKKILVPLLISLLTTACSAANFARPVKFDTVEESTSFEATQAPITSARWIMQFSASDEARKFLLPTSFQHANPSISASAHLLHANDLKTPLTIAFVKKNHKDIYGNTYFGIAPTVDIPRTGDGDRVEVNFSFSNTTRQIMHYLPMGPIRYSDRTLISAPVDKATIEIRSFGVEVATSAVGFEEVASTKENGWSIKRFSMLPESKNLDTQTGASSPNVSASAYRDWSEIARPQGLAYQQELAKDLDAESAIKTLPQDVLLAPASKERTRILANHLFKWIVSNFTYRATALDPEFSRFPRPMEKTWQNREGDCKDLSLVFIKLLAMTGIKAEPVAVPMPNFALLPRRSSIPIAHFNHIIVSIPEIGEYTDLTLGTGAYLTLWSDAYANTFGLHLFSSDYRAIKPGTWNNEIRVHTLLKQENRQWTGKTRWIGRGDSLTGIPAVYNYLAARSTEGNPKSFERNGQVLRPASWVMHKEELTGQASLEFDFISRKNLSDPNGLLIEIPSLYRSSLLKYNIGILPATGSSCFGSELAEETIEIEGLLSVRDFAKFSDVKVSGIASEFTQKIDFSGGKLRIARRLTVNEQRGVCPAHEVKLQQQFYGEIEKLRDATAAAFAGQGRQN